MSVYKNAFRVLSRDPKWGMGQIRRSGGIVVGAFFYYSGLVRLTRWLMQRTKPNLIILNYHRASGGDLRRHLLYLRRHYRMLHLEEALEELYTPGGVSAQDRRTPLVLTFDDGYLDNYTHAFELACELEVPITVFLIPGYLESGAHFWWGEGSRLVRHASAREVAFAGRNYCLESPKERAELTGVIDGKLRHAASVEEREACLAQVHSLLVVPETEATRDEQYRPMTWDQVIKMQESGWVSFGGHTMHHPILSNLSDPEEVRAEVAECRKTLQERLGGPVRAFAYPIGKNMDIGEEAIKAVQAAGFAWAVTTNQGVNTPQDDPYQLKRVLGEVNRHWLVMAAELSGVWNFFSAIWK
ncbi:MAG TPA: polysaccharide deacetylase family protein [Ktedonosporobacter sp.]|nr:polysaccharide deacetylase family protein [Ktedonosporobacter sp.]